MKANKKVFPYRIQNSNGQTTVYTGLQVRDYIAIQAMVGLSANPDLTNRSLEDIADIAYRQADAMIKRSEIHEQSI